MTLSYELTVMALNFMDLSDIASSSHVGHWLLSLTYITRCMESGGCRTVLVRLWNHHEPGLEWTLCTTHEI